MSFDNKHCLIRPNEFITSCFLGQDFSYTGLVCFSELVECPHLRKFGKWGRFFGGQCINIECKVRLLDSLLRKRLVCATDFKLQNCYGNLLNYFLC